MHGYAVLLNVLAVLAASLAVAWLAAVIARLFR